MVTMDLGMYLIRVADEGLTPDSRVQLRQLKPAIDTEFRQLLAAGIKEEALAPGDPKMTAFAIAGGLSWIGRWFQPNGEYSAEDVVQQCISTVLNGVFCRKR